MRIFGKASKSYPQNSELRGHCGADSRVIRAKLSANEIARDFKKAAKGAGVKEQILLNLELFTRDKISFSSKISGVFSVSELSLKANACEMIRPQKRSLKISSARCR